jgi:glycosyltransferase involved in cell wall biosynthesis
VRAKPKPDVVFVVPRTGVGGETYGGEKSTIETARGLAARGVRPRILTTAADDFARDAAAAGLDVEIVDIGDPFTGFRAAPLAEKARRVAGVLRMNAAVWRAARGGAVVHAKDMPGFLCGWLAARAARAGVIYHVRGASRGRRVRALEEVAMLLADRTIAVSGSLREQLLGGRLARLLAARVRAVPNGFDFARMDATPPVAPRADGRVRALVVGAFWPDKGQLALLEEVIPRVVAALPAFHVTFVGGVKDVAYHDACRAAARDLAGHVDFTGYLPEDEVFRRYRAADLLILSSQREGLPRCVIEAQAFALPVVATAIVGSVEALRDGETGFLVPPDRLGDMVEPILRLARDPALRARMGRAGAAHVRASFGLDRNVEAIAGIYREIL